MKGQQMIDFGTEKKQCFDEYENGTLIMSDDKCGDCEHKYECRFMQEAMDEVVYGSD
jgi:phage-related protein